MTLDVNNTISMTFGGLWMSLDSNSKASMPSAVT